MEDIINVDVLTGAAGSDAISQDINQAGLSNAGLIRLMSALSLDGETLELGPSPVRGEMLNNFQQDCRILIY